MLLHHDQHALHDPCRLRATRDVLVADLNGLELREGEAEVAALLHLDPREDDRRDPRRPCKRLYNNKKKRWSVPCSLWPQNYQGYQDYRHVQPVHGALAHVKPNAHPSFGDMEGRGCDWQRWWEHSEY